MYVKLAVGELEENIRGKIKCCGDTCRDISDWNMRATADAVLGLRKSFTVNVRDMQYVHALSDLGLLKKHLLRDVGYI